MQHHGQTVQIKAGGLGRDQNIIRRIDDVKVQQRQIRVRVDEDIIIIAALDNGAQDAAHDVLAADLGKQRHVQRTHRNIRHNDVDILKFGGLYVAVQVLLRQHRRAEVLLAAGHVEAAGQVALPVAVDDEDAQAQLGHRGGNAAAQAGLAAAALVVEHAEHLGIVVVGVVDFVDVDFQIGT